MPVLRTELDIDLDPVSAFDGWTEALADALQDLGMRFEPSPHGRIVEGDMEVGCVTVWEPGKRILLSWQPPDWTNHDPGEIEIRFEPAGGGARVSLEHRGWDRALESGTNRIAWFAGAIAAPLLQATTPTGLGDWLTDRQVRRPSGPQAREIYRDPVYHRPNFRAILAWLQLTPGDYLIEVGCGGGAFLEDALHSGCRAAAIDHSPDMVRLARQANHQAIEEGRLEIRQADADHLPFADSIFTCAATTGVFGFLPDPVAALKETHRVLQPHGRLAVFTGSAALRGTPAAPEPFASHINFYEDDELVELARQAGFVEVRVEHPDLYDFAREAGVPEEALPLFKGTEGGQLLVARKSGEPII